MVHLRISSEDAIQKIRARMEALARLQENPGGPAYYDLVRWGTETWPVIDSIYGSEDPHSEELRTLSLANCSCNATLRAMYLAEAYESRLTRYLDEMEKSGTNPV